jgi:alkylation response protein AidB-like acyl-CoA dehydrogenase
VWSAVEAADDVTVELRVGLRLAATHAVRSAAAVARDMHDLGGGAAIYESSPLQRRLRDAHAATAHFQVNAATWELTGRLLLGQPTETTML